MYALLPARITVAPPPTAKLLATVLVPLLFAIAPVTRVVVPAEPDAAVFPRVSVRLLAWLLAMKMFPASVSVTPLAVLLKARFDALAPVSVPLIVRLLAPVNVRLAPLSEISLAMVCVPPEEDTFAVALTSARHFLVPNRCRSQACRRSHLRLCRCLSVRSGKCHRSGAGEIQYFARARNNPVYDQCPTASLVER